MVRRSIAIFFLLLFIESTFQSSIAYALTTGPHQPEYTSYEAPGATDLVNLSTGDFSFSLPLLEVPGPEGSFSLPLAYNAGIGLEQQSSWVGLGWTMNAGAITRSINEFPDDAAGESQTITVQDLTGVRGWTSSVLGLGNVGWNSMTGHYGSVSILGIVGYNWSAQDHNSVSVVGVSVGNGGVTFDPVQFTMAVVTIVSFGAAGVAAGAANAASAIAKQAAVSLAMGAAMSAFQGRSAGTPNSPTAGYWKYSKKVKQKFLHKEYKIWLDKTRVEDMYGTMYLAQANANMEAYGTPSDGWINFGLQNAGASETLYKFRKGTGAFNQGSASDINYDLKDDAFHQSNNPALLAFDDYTVNAPGISGSISPYRFDVGAVSMPREMTKSHIRLAPVKFENYKVPFVYEGAVSNSYFHHVGGSSGVTTPTFYSGLGIQVANSNPQTNTSMTFTLNDVALKTQRVRSDVSDFLTPGNNQNKFAQGNHIEWLSNVEIKNGVTYPSKFIDFLSATGGVNSDRQQFRSNFLLGSSTIITSSIFATLTNFSPSPLVIPLSSTDLDKLAVNDIIDLKINFFNDEASYQDGSPSFQQQIFSSVQVLSKTSTSVTLSTASGMAVYAGKFADIEIQYVNTPQLQTAIGGYCITGPDGTTYHFALPVYDYDQTTEIRNVSDNNKKSIIKRGSPFANTWLLTAITGPDFIDRNANGLADDSDWGFWVKFNYGKRHDNYQWRIPYQGYKRSKDNASESYSQGFKQLYYLNTIETRSHVALFLKSNNEDAKSVNPTQLRTLKLDEILLLSKEHYKKLVSTYAMPEYSNKFQSVLLSVPAAAQSFASLHAVKRVQFTYTYDLCKNTPSAGGSSNPNNGKLTLTRVSVLGRNNTKIVPDYRFEYGNNPNYHVDKWDGWSMYSSVGTTSPTSHHTPENDVDGTAWSLSKITTPLGSEIIVNYERDSYESLAGTKVYGYNSSFWGSGIQSNTTRVPGIYNTSNFAVNDRVQLTGGVYYDCEGMYYSKSLEGEYTITEVGSDYINVNGNYLDITTVCSSSINVNEVEGSITKIGKKGGNLRVASIINRDEWGIENKIRYLYINDDGSSSGVIAKEPDYIANGSDPTANLPGFPFTPVMYGKVTVLTGLLSTDLDYHTKQVYEFETPHANMITANKTTVFPKTEVFREQIMFGLYKVASAEVYQHNIVNRTSKIGALKSLKTYDKGGVLVSQSQMSYTDQPVNDMGNNYQGLFSEGALMFDQVWRNNSGIELYNKVNRTSVLHYPYTLQNVTNTKDGFTSESKNVKWDFLTGHVIEKIEKSALGISVKTVTVPAYKVSQYAEFGPKSTSLSNKHMLSQPAASYVYRVDDTGTILGLISASAQVWKKDWNNYRIHNAGTYTDGAEGDQVWRKQSSYVWKGSYAKLQPDGTHKFVTGDEFNFASSSPNTNWHYAGEVLRYDHYGMPLASKTFDNLYSAVKMGYDNRTQIASAANANYNEIAFSSAEDLNSTINFFGGEVALGNGAVFYKSKGQLISANTGDANITEAHTGDALVALTSGTSFVYKPTGLETNKKYRASVWTNSTNGRIHYKLNGGAEVVSNAPVAATKAGNWYRVNLEIPIGATFTSLEVGVKSSGGVKIVFDDFRFQPVDAVMTCYVADPLDFEYTTGATNTVKLDYVLDNDNFFTRYEYNERGVLKRTFVESFQYGVKKVSESDGDYRRFYTNQ